MPDESNGVDGVVERSGASGLFKKGGRSSEKGRGNYFPPDPILISSQTSSQADKDMKDDTMNRSDMFQQTPEG